MINFDFNDILKNIKNDVDITMDQCLELTKKTTLDAHGDLVLATPVDTGQARQGWTVTMPTKENMQGVIENDVPYIAALNDGHSKQAPKGFVEATVQKYNGGL